MSGFLDDQEIEQFKKLIDNYQMNSSARAEFVASHFAVIAGPAGAGKDTVRNLLIKNYPDKYAPILSTTTRSPRIGEQDGVDYHFRPKAGVLKSLSDGEFFQSALVHNQQASCLHIDEIKKLRAGQTGLSILIVQTEQLMSKVKSDIKTIFLIPPNLAELKSRAAKNRILDEAEMSRRLQAAQKELQIALDEPRYYCVINDNLNITLELSNNFFERDIRDAETDKKARVAMESILKELQAV